MLTSINISDKLLNVDTEKDVNEARRKEQQIKENLQNSVKKNMSKKSLKKVLTWQKHFDILIAQLAKKAS